MFYSVLLYYKKPVLSEQRQQGNAKPDNIQEGRRPVFFINSVNHNAQGAKHIQQMVKQAVAGQ